MNFQALPAQRHAGPPRRTLPALLLAVAILAGTFGPTPALADAFPDHPVTIVLPVSAGSATDGLVRIVSQQLALRWGQGVIVVNKPGATGMIAGGVVAKAAPDGYTLAAISTSQVIATHLNGKPPYDIRRELRPVVRLGSVPLVLCERASLGADSVPQLVALAKAKPGSLNYGSAGKGTTSHIAGELFARSAGIRMTHVPYSAVSQAQSDLGAGNLDLLFLIPSAARQLVATQRVKCLATDSSTPLPMFPELPTMQQAGLDEQSIDDWIGLVAPVHTPNEVVQRISADVVAVLAQPETRKKIADLGVLARPLPIDEFSKLYESDFPRWGETLKKIGIADGG